MTTLTVEKESSHETQIRQWLHQWGNSTSEAILDTKSEIFTTPHVDGFIGYRLKNNVVVVFGDPVCSQEDTSRLTIAFQEFCAKTNKKVVYMLASEPFSAWLIQNSCKVLLEACEEMVFNPQVDPTVGPRAHKLRNKINHAIGLNCKVIEYTTDDLERENEMNRVCTTWLKSRKGPQIHLGPLQLFADRTDKRWFYIHDNNGNILSVAILRRLEANEGWFLKFLVTLPTAPRGTSELLMVTVLKTLRQENCHYLSAGMVPVSDLGIIQGLGKFYQSFTRNIFSLAKWVFNLENRKTYWEQFLPISHKSFIVFNHSNIGIKEILALMKALNVNV